MMNSKDGYTCLLACALIAAPFATSQGADEEADPAPPTDSASVFLENTHFFAAELSTDKKKAVLKTAFAIPDDNHLLRLNLSGPFDEQNSQAIVGDLDRFASMASAEVGYQWIDNHNEQDIAVAWTIGGKSFKYADPANLAMDKKEDEVGYGASIAYQKLLHVAGGLLLSGRARYQRVHEAQPDQQLCTVLDDGSSLRCRTTGLGAPKEVDSLALQFQAATVLHRSLGMSLLLSHDFKSDDTGIEVPLYLIRDDKSGLFTGGLKLSWRSEQDDLRAILFIGIPLGDWGG